MQETADAAATTTTRTAVGHRFRIEGSPEVVEAAEEIFSTLPAVAPGGDEPELTFHATVRPEGVRVVVADEMTTMSDLGGALDYVQWHLNRLVVAGLGPAQTALHAACAVRDGHLVLLPAASGGGKSTTVAGLVRAGWAYVTDEASILDAATLEVQPYPKPISIDHGAWPLFPELADRLRSDETCLVPATRLQAASSTSSLATSAVATGGPVAAVVAPSYHPGVATELQPLTPGALLMLLAQSTFAFNEDGPRHLRCLAELTRRSVGYRLVIGDLDQAVALLDGVVDELPS